MGNNHKADNIMHWISKIKTFCWMDQLKSWEDDHNEDDQHTIEDIGQPTSDKDFSVQRSTYSSMFVQSSFIREATSAASSFIQEAKY